MLIVYKILINFVFFFSPIIIVFRIFKGKEDILRFKEKIGFFSKKRSKGNLIWFHGASVGEIQSIIPLVERFEKNKKIKQILIFSLFFLHFIMSEFFETEKYEVALTKWPKEGRHILAHYDDESVVSNLNIHNKYSTFINYLIDCISSI